jgi:hypothetical protein
MSIVLDARPFAEAAKAAIRAQLGEHDVYEYGQVPGFDRNEGPQPDLFALLSIERIYNPTLRLTAQAGATGWRVAVRCLGTTVNESRWVAWRVAVALNEQRLTVAGRPTTRLQMEPSDDSPTRDDGRYVADVLYRFAH